MLCSRYDPLISGQIDTARSDVAGWSKLMHDACDQAGVILQQQCIVRVKSKSKSTGRAAKNNLDLSTKHSPDIDSVA